MSEPGSRSAWDRRHRWIALAVLVLVAVSGWVVATRVTLSPDVAPLLPDQGEGAALGRYARVFGGGEPGVVLLEGESPDEVSRATEAVVRSLGGLGRATSRVEVDAEAITASQWLLLADEGLRERIVAALSDEGMASRLSETRALLLAPGSAALAPRLAHDPLRIGQLVAESRAGGGRRRGDGELATADGRARLVVVSESGNSLRSKDAHAFVAGAEAALGEVRRAHPGVAVRLTGGHALAVATEGLLRSDLTRSGVLALVLASLAFVGLQRRPRALLAVLPPLAAGTLVAASVGALFRGGVAGVAVAFVSVAMGVGMDTGVHVHAAVRQAVAAGSAGPVREALAHVTRPVLGAALVASCAFGSLVLSRVEALRQLGVLAAVSEVSTALCIWALSPWISWWLERRSATVPAAPGWARRLVEVSRWGPLRAVSVGVLVSALVALGLGGLPDTSAGFLAIRPEGLAPQQVYREVARRFGDEDRAPWVVLVSDADEGAARTRADRVFAALAARPDVALGVDALTPWAPSAATLRERQAALGALDLPGRARALEGALRAAGFAPQRFAGPIEDLAHPRGEVPDSPLLVRRYVGHDGERSVVRLEVRSPDEAALRAVVRAVDAQAEVTGWGALDPTLRSALRQDLPRVGALAALLLVVSLVVAVRRGRDVLLAGLVVVGELALVLVLMRVLGVPLHIYDALVLPVLLGVTVDEVLFVLWAVRRGEAAEEALVSEAPLVAATALTTAAGFLGLLICQFAPLRHLGMVAALGSVVGLLLALLVVPAWARATPPRAV